jgi:hypothetical protein
MYGRGEGGVDWRRARLASGVWENEYCMHEDRGDRRRLLGEIGIEYIACIKIVTNGRQVSGGLGKLSRLELEGTFRTMVR